MEMQDDRKMIKCQQESLALLFEMAHLYEDSLREYDELEIYYLQTGLWRNGPWRIGYDQSAMLKAGNKQLTQIVKDSSFREFEFRQYFFARQAKLLIVCGCSLPFCTREVWVLTSCLSLVNATADHHKDGIVTPEIEKEYYCMRGELYFLCRVKVHKFCKNLSFLELFSKWTLDEVYL
ncbi:trafficking protein particle complex II-specific subunit 130 [Artemisia annua]|uniref:Trafficking protein particle complex II-specific subunit 130 n=1 Tax=Artemisia annua TaxID=35608 RepID=A0A2U1NMY8_ARTAN|nr:trafficking protein particle complex II-specific subunit 130 [Artemisia annua]